MPSSHVLCRLVHAGQKFSCGLPGDKSHQVAHGLVALRRSRGQFNFGDCPVSMVLGRAHTEFWDKIPQIKAVFSNRPIF